MTELVQVLKFFQIISKCTKRVPVLLLLRGIFLGSLGILTCAPGAAAPDSGAALCSTAGKCSELWRAEWASARKQSWLNGF